MLLETSLQTSNCKLQGWYQANPKGNAACHWKCRAKCRTGPIWSLWLVTRHYQKLRWGWILPPKMQVWVQRCSDKERHFGALLESSLIRTCINDTRRECEFGVVGPTAYWPCEALCLLETTGTSCFCSKPRAKRPQKMLLTTDEDAHHKTANRWQQHEAHGRPSWTHTPTTAVLTSISLH